MPRWNPDWEIPAILDLSFDIGAFSVHEIDEKRAELDRV